MTKTEYILTSGDVSALMRPAMDDLRERVSDGVTVYELGVMLGSCLNNTLSSADLSVAEHQKFWQELISGLFDYHSDLSTGFTLQPSAITGAGLHQPH